MELRKRRDDDVMNGINEMIIFDATCATQNISQPYISLIVRGKAAALVEFETKLDLSIDENGMARLEKIERKEMRDLHCEETDNVL